MTLATVIRCAAITGLCIAQATVVTEGQGAPVDYQRAERFLGDAVKQLVYDGTVAPRWIGGSGRFWYVKDGPSGKEFLIADPAQNARTAAFDHEKLAAAASRVGGRTYTARALPFDRLRFRDNERTLYAEGGGLAVNCDLTAYTCTRTAVLFDDEGQETGPNRPFAEGDPPPRADVPSPDGTHTAYIANHNLWVRNLKTGETISVEPRRRASLRLRHAAAEPDADAAAGQGRRRPDAGRVLVTRLDQDRDLRDGPAQLPAPDHDAVGAEGSVPAEIFQLRLSAAGGFRPANVEAGDLRRAEAQADVRGGTAAHPALLRRTARRLDGR